MEQYRDNLRARANQSVVEIIGEKKTKGSIPRYKNVVLDCTTQLVVNYAK